MCLRCGERRPGLGLGLRIGDARHCADLVQKCLLVGRAVLRHHHVRADIPGGYRRAESGLVGGAEHQGCRDEANAQHDGQDDRDHPGGIRRELGPGRGE